MQIFFQVHLCAFKNDDFSDLLLNYGPQAFLLEFQMFVTLCYTFLRKAECQSWVNFASFFANDAKYVRTTGGGVKWRLLHFIRGIHKPRGQLKGKGLSQEY